MSRNKRQSSAWHVTPVVTGGKTMYAVFQYIDVRIAERAGNRKIWALYEDRQKAYEDCADLNRTQYRHGGGRYEAV